VNAKVLQSDEDEDPELLMIIPFTSPVQIRAIQLSSASNPPRSVKLIVNREGIDFSDAETLEGQQELDLVVDGSEAEYPLKVHKFLNVSNLALFFKGEDDFVQVDALELKGVSTKYKREAVLAVYESKPMLQDHSVPSASQASHSKNPF
jgi:hypothetical protein